MGFNPDAARRNWSHVLLVSLGNVQPKLKSELDVNVVTDADAVIDANANADESISK
jgi:hypothetical protein